MWKSSLAVRVHIEVAQTALAYVSLLMFFFLKILLMFKLDQHNLHLDIRMITDKQSLVFLMSKVAVRLPLLMMPNFKLLTKVRLNPKNAWKKCLHLIQTKCRNFAQTPIDLKALTIWRWYQRFFTFEIRDFCPLCMFFIHPYVLVLYSYWSAIIV